MTTPVLAVVLAAAPGNAPPGDASPRFTDVTESSGVRFTNHGGSGRLLILDTMGGGLACADFDGDGDDDLYLLTGSQLDPYEDDKSAPINRLYRNEGGLRFRDVTEASGTGLSGWSMGTAAGDYDGDGDLDLYVTRYGPDVLLRNDTVSGGELRFADVTAAAKLGDPRWGTGAAFFDYDRDGDLDLYVANYVDFEGRLARYGGDLDHPDFKDFKQLPHFFESQPDSLYRNEGDGTFTDVTKEARIVDGKGKGLGVCACDFDDDGDDDLYVASDTTPNSLFVNRGDGTFDELGAEAGVALGGSGRPEGTMGVAVGDIDGDQRFDLLITNFDNEPKSLYRNEGELGFVEVSREAGLQPGSNPFVGWGSELQDFDCDGDLDVFMSNGHVITDVPLFLIRHLLPASRLPGVIEPEHFGSGYEQRQLLYLNDGRGKFRDGGKSAGPFFERKIVGRGAIAADLDVDGDLDLVISRSNEPTIVLRNDLAGPAGPAWLEVELRQDGKNRFAVGARIRVEAAGKKQIRQIVCGDSYLSQHSLAQHFGLGSHKDPVDVTIRWPDGSEQVEKGVATCRRVVIRRKESGPP